MSRARRKNPDRLSVRDIKFRIDFERAYGMKMEDVRRDLLVMRERMRLRSGSPRLGAF